MQIKDTIIVIMSSNRAGRVVTHKKFTEGVIHYVVAVPEEQEEEYKAAHKDLCILGIPDDVPSFIAPQRQWVMEHFAKEFKYIWLMDDDLTFLRRCMHIAERVKDLASKERGEKVKELTKLKKSKKKHVKDMFLMVRAQLETYPIVSVSPRLGNNRREEDFVDVGRMMDNYAFNSKVFMDEEINFAPYPDIIGEDFHVTLTYLNKGHANRIIFCYSQTDGGRNAEGGCSDYRTNEIQKKAAFWLADNHPEVTVKTKKSDGWKGLKGTSKDGSRVDMIVQWKKAYKPKKVRKAGGLSRLLKK